MINILDKNRIFLIIGLMLTVIFGFIIWFNAQSKLTNLNTQISDSNDRESKYIALIAQKNSLHRHYVELLDVYVGQKKEIANLQAAFFNDVDKTTKKYHVQFVGAAIGAINGSNPPAPNPYVDKSGQPIGLQNIQNAAPGSQNQARGSLETDLGGRATGDPKTEQPVIPPGLFTRVPVTITLKGSWRGLASSLQDISKEDILMSIADPEVKKLDKDNLTLSFSLQILIPAVTLTDNQQNLKKIKTSMTTKKIVTNTENKKITKVGATRKLHGIRVDSKLSQQKSSV